MDPATARSIVTTPSFAQSRSVADHYKSSPSFPRFKVTDDLKKPSGFFCFGDGIICYGQTTGVAHPRVNGNLFNASQHVHSERGTIVLPFDIDEVLKNLRYERYLTPPATGRWRDQSWVQQIYYALRPMLPISFRKYLQRMYLRDWNSIEFPDWPVDCSVDLLLEKLLVLAMQQLRTKRVPFIWFWPEGHKACAILTHDVETTVGRDFTGRLMDIDDSFGIKASFQIVPEKRYSISPQYLETIRSRGFELNVHGLDHEGNLFQNRETFKESAKKINHYAKLYGCRGFRSPIFYRNVDWFQDLDFSYDMSVPNVARLEAQRGGCCTVMPYFLPGDVLELPLTTTEDYSLFHILNDYSTKLWKQQISTILKAHGLISFVIHPDYVVPTRAQAVYKELLDEIRRLQSERDVWVTIPRNVDDWWRQRSRMNLVPDGEGWTIQGTGANQAKVAYACLDGDRLVYEIDAGQRGVA